MAEIYIYHSPDGDRKVPLLQKNADGTVDLGEKDALDIGKCQVGGEIGQAEPKGDDDDEEGELTSLSVKQLQDEADKLGVPHAGLKKKELIAAIEAALSK